jgi:thioesterase domain-containing protein
MATISSYRADDGGLIQLKKGGKNTPLFLFSGADADPRALDPLASQLRSSWPVIGVDFCRRGDHDQWPSTVELMANRSCAAIRMLQPCGPYHIVGYSFGGLVGMEVAHLLQRSGEQVALLGLIDTLFDQRFWPTAIFLRSQARLIRRHLAILVGLPLREVLPSLFIRSQRLLLRIIRRQIPASLTIPTPGVEAASALEEHCKTAMSKYRPKYYDGRITCFNAADHRDFGCDPAELWQGMAAEIECRSIAGTHVGIVADRSSLADLASALDAALHDLAKPLGGSGGSSSAAP